MKGRRVESFLLRLVVDEPVEAGARPWRGRIQHVSSGYERQFERVQDMLAFIEDQVSSRRSFLLSFQAPVDPE